ncbi:MAG: adaptor protein MecA [Lachnospiraceae bacterium]|nr:adaptor protein MecA [Lachnospiraceae bacterium]
MKIEKVNENQIRCTLTKEDLASRHLKISELAYGTEKAKTLFRDMMQQANYEFGFEAEDIPLMIEAIPLNAECIVLIVTKVEDPEELDTRFSRFAPSVTEEYDEDEEFDAESSSDEMLDLFRRIQESSHDQYEQTAESTAAAQESMDEKQRTRVFRMDSLHQVMDAAVVVSGHFHGESTLYKDERQDKYLLILTQGEDTAESFDRICNVLSEYGTIQRTMPAALTFFEEHCDALIKDNALEKLGQL